MTTNYASKSAVGANKRGHTSNVNTQPPVLRGGRMTKFKGIVASYAPSGLLSVVAIVFGTTLVSAAPLTTEPATAGDVVLTLTGAEAL